MRILFVETRAQTELLELVAKELVKNGHEIAWLVQNHLFKANCGKQFIIPYPKNKDLKPFDPKTAHFAKVAKSDRSKKYFNVSSKHYAYYDAQIRRIIEHYKPDVVFGEHSLFHAYLCSEICREQHIPYISPVNMRFPRGRFGFILYDTMQFVGGSGQSPEHAMLLEMANGIASRNIKPTCISKRTWAETRFVLKTQFKTILSYYLGEKYNTPSPARKRWLTKSRNAHRFEWDKISQALEKKPGKISILYPMQMQPEENIDVWGRHFCDQKIFLQQMCDQLDERYQIIVKVNPSAKYELNQELLAFAQKSEQIVCAPFHLSMQEVLPFIDVIVTVSGTVAYEAIFESRPVVVFTPLFNTPYPGQTQINNVSDLETAITKVVSDQPNMLGPSDGAKLLKSFYEMSYLGKAQVHDKMNPCSASNIKSLVTAFEDLLNNQYWQRLIKKDGVL